MCVLVTVPTLSAQCACLTARFMPWWAFCVLACLAPVSRQVSTAMAVSYRVVRRDRCSQRRGGGGNCVQFEMAAGGEGCSEQCHAARCVSSGLRCAGRLLRPARSGVCREELPDCRHDSSCKRGILNTQDVEFPVLRRYRVIMRFHGRGAPQK